MAYRVNGQYIMEGLASSFMFAMGGIGFVILDKTNQPMAKLQRIILLLVGIFCVPRVILCYQIVYAHENAVSTILFIVALVIQCSRF